MTCRYSGSDWLDVLYMTVRDTSGGVADCANFLSTRRGRSIGTETLRLRLRNEGDSRLSMEQFELIIEWMEEKGNPNRLDALHALNERFGMIAAPIVVDADGGVNALTHAACGAQADVGDISRVVVESVADRKIDDGELARIERAAKRTQRSVQKVVETARHLNRSERK